MTDSFILFDEPRRPWLAEDALKKKFHELSVTVHPDRAHALPEAERQAANQRYAELNAAYQCLRDTRDRLRHLLELERGGRLKDVQRIPPGTMDLFVEIGQLCQDIDRFAAGKAQITSPLLKVQWFQQSQDWLDKLDGLQKSIQAKRETLEAELREMNAAWETAPPPGHPARAGALPLDRLEELYRVMSYVTRWTEQVQERRVQLVL